MFARELHPSAFRTIGPPPTSGSGALMAKVTLFGETAKRLPVFSERRLSQRKRLPFAG